MSRSQARVRDARGGRVDEIRPSAFDPVDYRVAGYVDVGGTEETNAGAEPNIDDRARWDRLIEEAVDHGWDGACQHCGHPGIRWVAVVEQTSTGRGIAFGAICAERAQLPDRDALRLRALQRRAAALAEKQQRLNEAGERIARWIAGEAVGFRAEGDPSVREAAAEFLFTQVTDDDSFIFIREMREKLAQWGDLSDKQAAAVVRIRDERARPREERPEPTTPAPEGRVQVEGEVVKVDWREDDWGGSLKMVVRLDDGNAVWGTVPSAISSIVVRDAENRFQGSRSLERGDRVRFTGTFERSDRDEHFAFFKRPAKAELLNEGRS